MEVSPHSPATKCVFLTVGSQFLVALDTYTGYCAVSTDSIHANLVVRGSLAQDEEIELFFATGRCLLGMLRYSHRVCMQKDLVRGRQARLE